MTLLPTATDVRSMLAEGSIFLPLLRNSILLASEVVPRENWPGLLAYLETTHGAAVILPDAGNSWASHMAEITLYGITGRGATAEEAFEEWCRAARRTIAESAAA